ncbi:MAG: DUF1499 domain-containing protein [Phycisphaeraceae bacterium]
MAEHTLPPCPKSPNCVCTQDPRPARRPEPVAFDGTAEQAMAAVLDVLHAEPRTRIVEQTPTYVHAVVSTRFLRFRDDVEFLIDREQKVIHYRSAARVGWWDFGVNRKRMKRLSDELNQRP